MTQQTPSIKVVKIDDSESLRPDPENANLGTERGRQMLARSIETLRAGRSVLVDAKGVVLAGNKTLQAARDAGIDEVLVVRTKGDQLGA